MNTTHRPSTRTPHDRSPAPPAPTASTPSALQRRRPFALARAAAVIVAVVVVAIAPVKRTLSMDARGDQQLVDEVVAAVEPGSRDTLAVARIDTDGTIHLGSRGADEHSPFEIGSITKTFTAALFADAVERGELRPESTLGELVPEVTGEAADVTLQQLATHTSGLPNVAYTGPWHFTTTLASRYIGGNPYADITETDLITMLDGARVNPGQEPTYSNLGIDALGLAVARAADEGYEALLNERILAPLGMHETTLATTEAAVPANAVHGYTAGGDRAAFWTSDAAAPSGALMSTTHDLLIWTQALLDGSAPGTEALEPITEFDEGSDIGYAWFTDHARPGDGYGSPGTQPVVWHNGMTGGSASVLGMGEDGTAVIALSNTAVDVTGALSLVATPDGGEGRTEENAPGAESAEVADRPDETTREDAT